jgi:putative pyruvate formate lyase activating enzyme
MSTVNISINKIRACAEHLSGRLASCDICPRKCYVNRLKGELGFCHSGELPIVSSFCIHTGEEPVLSGSHGSGTIFFANCNLRCAYCQNFQISQNPKKQKNNEVSIETLAAYMLELQAKGCHNINLVSPSHFVPQIVSALAIAIPQGFDLPLVYNTNAYESMETLKELEGIVDIYLPDIKYASDDMAIKYSSAPGYTAIARQAIKEMWYQAGKLEIDDDAIAQKGTIIRHLILPNGIAGTEESLKWLSREVSPDITVSLMSQYHPVHRAREFSKISRQITMAEYETALQVLEEAGLENGWVQNMESPQNYLPDFERGGHPFETEG